MWHGEVVHQAAIRHREAVTSGAATTQEVVATTEDAPRRGVRDSLRVFRHRDFRLFWTGAVLSNTGYGLQSLTVPFIIYQLTGSALWVGMIAAAEFIPSILLSPLGGSLADRFDRRRILLITQSFAAAVAALLWLIWVVGWHEPALILATVALGSTAIGITLPTWQAFVNDLVPRNDLLAGITMNSLQYNIARAVGPAIAGVLLAAFGPSWALALNALSYVAVITALLLVRTRSSGNLVAKGRGVMRQFVDAARYVRSQPGIIMAIVVSFIVGAIGQPMVGLTVVFAKSVYDVGPSALGLLTAALGVGAVVTAPALSSMSGRAPLSRIVWIGLIVYGIAVLAFAVLPDYRGGLVALVLVGGCHLAVLSSANTALQVIVADDIRGRALAVRSMIFFVSFPVGGLVWGALADSLGPRVMMLVAGGFLLVSAAVLLSLRGTLRLARLDDPHDARTLTPAA